MAEQMDSFSWYEGNRQRYYVPWESYRSYHQQLRGGGVKSQRYQHDESSSYYVPTKLRGGSETDWEWTGSEWKAAGASKKYKKIVEKDPRWRGGKRDKYITKQARGRMEDVYIGELDPEEVKKYELYKTPNSSIRVNGTSGKDNVNLVAFGKVDLF